MRIKQTSTVSSVRSIFQNKTIEKESSTVSFKNPPTRLTKRDDEMFFQKPIDGSSKPSRLTSSELFFEPPEKTSTPEKIQSPVKEDINISKMESDSKDKTEEGKDENRRPRTPQDIWEASQEEFVKKEDTNVDETSAEEKFDDVTSRTHVLLMKQASVPGGELPAQVQMAQILGDKSQV